MILISLESIIKPELWSPQYQYFRLNSGQAYTKLYSFTIEESSHDTYFFNKWEMDIK